MNKESVETLKQEIIAIGKLMWDKDLASGLNGNISVRVDDKTILLTGRGTCLGRLHKDEILLLDLQGHIIEGRESSSEKLLHTEVYKTFAMTQAVIHTHTTYANGYFSVRDRLMPATFESRLYLGDIQAIAQTTPTVTDVAPVLEALSHNNIVVLKNHGILSAGKNLFDCFVLLQCLEDAVKMDVVGRICAADPAVFKNAEQKDDVCVQPVKRFAMFSRDHIDEIVRLVNEDEILGKLGGETDMTMTLAVKLDETGDVYSFSFKKGKIASVGRDEDVEFLVSAPENIWRDVFNRRIDPFVATTQKKMNLRGDFAKISKWYAPCSRLFELWQKVPIR